MQPSFLILLATTSLSVPSSLCRWPHLFPLRLCPHRCLPPKFTCLLSALPHTLRFLRLKPRVFHHHPIEVTSPSGSLFVYRVTYLALFCLQIARSMSFLPCWTVNTSPSVKMAFYVYLQSLFCMNECANEPTHPMQCAPPRRSGLQG